jgi:hypothetical protein
MRTFGPSRAKPKPLSPGTEGSNPAPSSSESDANRFSGAHPLIAIRELAVARNRKFASIFLKRRVERTSVREVRAHCRDRLPGTVRHKRE